MKEELATLAQQLGFDVCRIAACVTPPHAAEFRAWLADGRAGEMAWLERNEQRRTDPQQVLPGARSIIVLAMNYWSGEGEKPDGQAHGRIAQYAWGDDYHDVIEKKLRTLDEWLISRGGRQRCYVDTGPVLERDLAAVAGAGWQGKSTMLIHPKLGTWFFLAEILTTLDFAPDAPMADHCGRCTRCIDACPTGAITAPRQLDARRCISYLTIENKGAIPEEFREAMGDRIYGCDDCLTACPWNRFAQASSESAFAAREYVHGWALRDFLALDDDSFRQLFRKSPIKRIKRRGFLRNVCVALGNIGTRDDLPALEKAAHDPEPLIVEHAQWAIARIRTRNGE
ncbi:MAG: tRNA epoxyqueuosine(34) reductase QueG [Chthoniobacter sp.]|uniref:tRNA epoxyqueuosine(34) reductase QueG n=1 Tax=Chthoniobacter sp. TaxID=2510640 RepID=UPI0032AC3BB6